ncbi:hypothetical protein [Roseovarius aestuariivivens]|uniref:hypothetical protein n=1 Tax=Roseovarius aestuariivivens TaxID=1888910 RepID=UPI001081FC79|nr:hypothetical protein [Roseovarius aestuariivivens]
MTKMPQNPTVPLDDPKFVTDTRLGNARGARDVEIPEGKKSNEWQHISQPLGQVVKDALENFKKEKSG